MPSPDRRSRLVAALAAAAALCTAIPALAAQLKDVRVGVHPKFTRIVFELDGRAGYRIERDGNDLKITIEATSSARSLRANGEVKIDAGTQARAHVALRDSDLRVREMILSDPPRIVLDVVKPETEVAAATAPKSTPKPAEAKPAAEPKPVAETKPAPAPKSIAEAKPAPKPAEPKPAAQSKPAPETKIAEAKPPSPAPKAAVEPKPVPEAKPTVEAKTEPAPKVEPAPPPSPAPGIVPAPRATEPTHSEPSPSPAPTAPAESASAPAVVPAPAPSPVPIEVPPTVVVPSPSPMPPAPSAPKPVPAAPPSSTPAPTRWTDHLSDPIWLGTIVVGVLGLAAIAVVMRRRRALPNDLDVTAIAEEVEATSGDAGGAAARIPSGGFAMGDDTASAPESSFGGLFDQPIAAAPAPPAPLPTFERTAPPIAPPPPLPTPAASAAEDSLFDDDAGAMPSEPESSGDAAMDTEMDLPVDRRTSPPAARMGGSAAPSSAPSPDVARMLQEFERRIATLEARLDESNEAREKLERQVAAQSEELRVQRAAIARTQRALRTMTRGDEDKATEPALRDGETQAKTRVTP
jgi:hypothetical protein